jgi:hypothetical protein
MTTVCTTPADLAVTNGNVSALASRVATAEAAIAKLTAALPVPIVVPPILPPYDPQVLWRATMESGQLIVPVGEWNEKVNSGAADSVAALASAEGITAHSGSYVLKQAVTGPSGGTRMHRYPEVDALCRAGTPFWWSWWDYFPTPITFGISDTFILWGLNSKSVAAPNGNTFWGLVFHNTGNTLDLVWSPTGAVGTRYVNSSPVPVPVGKWNFFEIGITPKGDATGHISVWLNGASIFNFTQAQTQYPALYPTDPLAGIFAWIEQCGYGSNLTPTPCVHYIDDVTISLGRMPYP